MTKAYLHLEDGTIFVGESCGAPISASGEVVFSTGMTGYVQSLTDPSFAGQILTFTYPLIGNYGVPRPQRIYDDLYSNLESEHIWTKGVIIGQHSQHPSHSESVETLSSWLKRKKVPGITGVDTRAVTQHLRDNGVMRGKILFSKQKNVIWEKEAEPFYVDITSIKTQKTYTPLKPNGKKIALIDCGMKYGILRALLSQGYQVTRLPWDMSPLDLDTYFDGIVVSNGPGDPKECVKTVANVKSVLAKGIPYLGICLGHQILALAIGANTYKLPFGHRGFNQPCQDLSTGRAYLTSQNHGYAVQRNTIPKGFEEWFINLNDQTNEGLRNERKKIASVQFHPEGEPGPADTKWIFDML